MGAWEELDREFTLDANTDDLDSLIEELSSSEFADIFEPARELAEKFKVAFEEGCEQGMEVIADNLVAKEQKLIGDTSEHPYSQGILETSIIAEGDVNSYIIGTVINHIYPMSVEYGADIYPTSKSVLKFQTLDGDIVYASEVHQKAKPYVEPAWQEVVSKVEGGYGVFNSVCDKMNQAIG